MDDGQTNVVGCTGWGVDDAGERLRRMPTWKTRRSRVSAQRRKGSPSFCTQTRVPLYDAAHRRNVHTCYTSARPHKPNPIVVCVCVCVFAPFDCLHATAPPACVLYSTCLLRSVCHGRATAKRASKLMHVANARPTTVQRTERTQSESHTNRDNKVLHAGNAAIVNRPPPSATEGQMECNAKGVSCSSV